MIEMYTYMNTLRLMVSQSVHLGDETHRGLAMGVERGEWWYPMERGRLFKKKICRKKDENRHYSVCICLHG
jgi:hypothetical protein